MKRYRHYKQDKAIILSCFGSVVEQQRYIDLQNIIKQKFDNCDVFLSFSSRMVLKNLNKTEIKYKNLPQTLADVDMLGFKNIIVASINLFPTDEHEVLKNTVKGFNSFLPSNIRYTSAIFSKTKTTTLFLKSLHNQINKSDSANLYIIHGTPSLELIGLESISYSANFLEFLDDHNYSCSLEGAYAYYAIKERLIKKLKKDSIKKVQIIPLLLVSGNHYLKDMNEIKDELSEHFDAYIAPSQTKSKNFNLIELEDTQKIIEQNIQDEIIKLG